jgi:hypothetical protein
MRWSEGVGGGVIVNRSEVDVDADLDVGLVQDTKYQMDLHRRTSCVHD